MKCQQCEKPATFHITELTEPVAIREVHLCEDCAREYLAQQEQEQDVAEIEAPASLAGALAHQLKVGQTAEELAQLDQRECPVCGITFYEFRHVGRLGCPHDYVCFEEELEPLIINIHGETKHVGKQPKQGPERAERMTELIRMRREMRECVEQEDYERASRLRDQIRQLEEEQSSSRGGLDGRPRRPARERRVAKSKTSSAQVRPVRLQPSLCWARGGSPEATRGFGYFPRTRSTAVKLEQMASGCGEWLRGSGPESDIVISSRIRLARNLADFPFIRRCNEADRAAIESIFRERVFDSGVCDELTYIDVSRLETVDRQFLVERQLISREHAESNGARGVAIDSQERASLMINEEDHLRIQVMHSGLALTQAWEQINRIDDAIEEKVVYACHSRLGYLTACPTNVGTGMRVSVMLHLPALVITRQIDKVFRSLQKISLAVRGLYGEGSQAMGDFYQISNQITLGRSEQELIEQVGDVVPVLIEYERRARDFLVQENSQDLHDRVSRAYGILCNAQTISSEETMHLLSSVRMGVNLGLIEDLAMPTVNKLFIHTQPAHLQKLRGVELDTADRNIERAHYLKKHLHRREENLDN